MTQNLRLVGPRTLTSENSDVTTSYNLPASSTSGWCTDATEACVNTANVLYSNNTTYGTYYSWRAVTAGTGTYSVASGNASASICPKGWKLPTGGSSNEFKTLYAKYNSPASIMATPVSLVRAGDRAGDTTFDQGAAGYYWTKAAYNNGIAYSLRLMSSTVNPADDFWLNKFYGLTVRCIAK